MYYVYINLTLKAVVGTTEEAWNVIGESTFGSLHHVEDENGDIVEEFIPL